MTTMAATTTTPPTPPTTIQYGTAIRRYDDWFGFTDVGIQCTFLDGEVRNVPFLLRLYPDAHSSKTWNTPGVFLLTADSQTQERQLCRVRKYKDKQGHDAYERRVFARAAPGASLMAHHPLCKMYDGAFRPDRRDVSFANSPQTERIFELREVADSGKLMFAYNSTYFTRDEVCGIIELCV
jgi:hypothetical protein